MVGPVCRAGTEHAREHLASVSGFERVKTSVSRAESGANIHPGPEQVVAGQVFLLPPSHVSTARHIAHWMPPGRQTCTGDSSAPKPINLYNPSALSGLHNPPLCIPLPTSG